MDRDTAYLAMLLDLAFDQSSYARHRAWAELEGAAFFRAFAQDPNQLAWDACTDPFAMVSAVFTAQLVPACKLVGYGIRLYVHASLDLVSEAAADPMEPDLREQVEHVRRLTQRPPSMHFLVERTIAMRAAVESRGRAEAALARSLRLALPLPPAGFGPLPDGELLRQVNRCDLPPRVRMLVDGMRSRFGVAGKLTETQREHAVAYLREYGGYRQFPED